MLVICYPQIGKVILVEAFVVHRHSSERIDVETADIGSTPVFRGLEIDGPLTRDRVGILRHHPLNPNKEHHESQNKPSQRGLVFLHNVVFHFSSPAKA